MQNFKNSLSSLQKGVLALVVLAFGFGMIANTYRYLSFQYPLFQQLYIVLLAGFIFSLIAFPRTLSLKRLLNIPSKDWLLLFFRVLVGSLIATSLYRQSLVLAKISNAVFIQSIPFTAVLGWVLFKEKVTFKKIMYVGGAYFGVLLIAMKDFSLLTSFGTGELYSLISGMLFSLVFLARKWQSDYLEDKEMTQILLGLSAFVLFLASMVHGDGFPAINFGLLSIGAVVLNGLLYVFNNYLINYGFKRVPAVLTGNILTLEAFFGLILAFLFYREFPNAKELLGGLIIVACVIGMNKDEKNFVK